MIPTTDLCDAHEAQLEAGTLRVVPPEFNSFGQKARFLGEAYTLSVLDDNSLVRATLETPGNDRVLVVDGQGSKRCGLVGGNLGELAVKNSWAGIVVYGCIRDSQELNALEVGIRALGTHPRKSKKRNSGEKQVPVQLVNVSVKPGNWVYADEDGVLISDERIHE